MRNIFVTLLLLFSTLVSAGVFKWVDADGKKITLSNQAKQIPLELCTEDHFKDIEGLD